MRWVGYVRVSTAEQGASGLGLEAQRAQIKAAMAPGDKLVTICRDVGVSGSVPPEKRPGASEALEMCSTGAVDGIIVAKLDRISRSIIHGAQLVSWCEHNTIRFRALDLAVDTSTPGGRLVMSMMMAFAEYELQVMAARQRDAHAARRARGIAGAARTVKRDRPDLARRVVAARKRGWTWQAIADRFNDEGIPTMRGGTMWRVSSVQAAGGHTPKSNTQRQTKPSVLPTVKRERMTRNPVKPSGRRRTAA